MSCYGAGSATSYIGNGLYRLPTKTIHAPTGRVWVFPVYNKQGRMVYLGATIIDGGTWVKYQNGKLVY